LGFVTRRTNRLTVDLCALAVEPLNFHSSRLSFAPKRSEERILDVGEGFWNQIFPERSD
jgi:hypothetical protein